mgnify:CR=1 FL=1
MSWRRLTGRYIPTGQTRHAPNFTEDTLEPLEDRVPDMVSRLLTGRAGVAEEVKRLEHQRQSHKQSTNSRQAFLSQKMRSTPRLA